MNLFEWNLILSHISDITDWLPFIVWIKLRKGVKIQYNFLGAYLFAIGALKTITLLTLKIKEKYNTMPFYHIMAIAESTLLVMFILRDFNIAKGKKIAIFSTLVLVNLTNSIFFQSYLEFNSNAWAFNTIILVGAALFSLYYLFDYTDNIELEKSSDFIITAALLLYFSGSLFLYIVSSEVLSTEANGFFHNAWIIRSSADILKSLILTYGLWIAGSNKTT